MGPIVGYDSQMRVLELVENGHTEKAASGANAWEKLDRLIRDSVTGDRIVTTVGYDDVLAGYLALESDHHRATDSGLEFWGETGEGFEIAGTLVGSQPWHIHMVREQA